MTPLPLGGDQRRCDERFRSLTEREDVLGHVVDVVALHLAARYGREGAADAGEEQFEVVVDLGGGADRRTRIARVDLLFDGDGRRDPRDEVDVGLVDLAQKLPGVGRQALHVAALPLGEDRVEGQGRLPEPERPVMTVSVSCGISTSMFRRLCTRAPLIWMLFGSFMFRWSLLRPLESFG